MSPLQCKHSFSKSIRVAGEHKMPVLQMKVTLICSKSSHLFLCALIKKKKKGTTGNFPTCTITLMGGEQNYKFTLIR